MNGKKSSGGLQFGIATIPVYLVCTVWAVYLLDFIIPGRLNAYGIVPRTARGLLGILSSNFLHAGFGHLVSNTVPLFVLSLLLVLFHRKICFQVISMIIISGGLLVWLFARSANHIGASMLIYGLAAFLICYGLMRKEVVPVLVSIFVALVYGLGMLNGFLPHGFISWEGHLFGAVGGVFAAYQYRKAGLG